MRLVRMIAPEWLIKEDPELSKVIEGEFTDEKIREYNTIGYNIYYRPNHPSKYEGGAVNGTHIDVFSWVFVDCDLKDGIYKSKDEFIGFLIKTFITPTKIVDSGNGVHAYWKITDLDCKSYLRLQRRLMRILKTDPAVGTVSQLMRLENTVNTKNLDDIKLCQVLSEINVSYTCEELDKLLPAITLEDEEYCINHYNNTYKIVEQSTYSVLKEMPAKWGLLLRKNKEAGKLFSHSSGDRSDDDFRLGLLMQINGFTVEEAFTVIMNSGKALQRNPIHRESYARNIVDKIWVKEPVVETDRMSYSAEEILSRSETETRGKRLECHKYIDDTKRGFHSGDVMGLIGGSGIGKTTIALNIFLGFAESNPEMEHFFCTLEQPDREIAERWQTMCGDNKALHSKVHIISNYDLIGRFKDLSLDAIKEYIQEFKQKTNKKIGCVVIDHIGVLSNNNRLGQDEGLKYIAKAMKTFALETDTFLIMQSQTSRGKGGWGDLELDKDAAFGVSAFENFCDYVVTLWQPLKRVYTEGAPTLLAFKLAKIRHKKQGIDRIQEDKRYLLFFDPMTERVRELTQDEEAGVAFYMNRAANERKRNKNTDVLTYESRRVDNEPATTSSDSNERKH